MSTYLLARITAQHFVAGIVFRRTSTIAHHSAPIIRYMVGWDAQRVLEYCNAKGWKIERVAAQIPIASTNSPCDI